MNAELAQFDVITSRHLQAAQLDDKQGELPTRWQENFEAELASLASPPR